MARIVRDSEAFGGVGDNDDVTFMETENSEDAGTVKRNPRLVTRKVELRAGPGWRIANKEQHGRYCINNLENYAHVKSSDSG